MSKKKGTLSFWGRIATTVCLALMVLALFCPVVSTQVKANAGDTQFNGDITISVLHKAGLAQRGGTRASAR